mgnify:CR=1 FL=1
MTATIYGKRYNIQALPLVVDSDVVLHLENWVFLRLLNTDIKDIVVENSNGIHLRFQGMVHIDLTGDTNQALHRYGMEHQVFAHHGKPHLIRRSPLPFVTFQGLLG